MNLEFANDKGNAGSVHSTPADGSLTRLPAAVNTLIRLVVLNHGRA